MLERELNPPDEKDTRKKCDRCEMKFYRDELFEVGIGIDGFSRFDEVCSDCLNILHSTLDEDDEY